MAFSEEQIQLTLREVEKARQLGTYVKATDPSLWGISEPHERTERRDNMVIHWDVAIPTRDGTILRGNIFLPETESVAKLPVLLNYSVYGKDWGVETAMFPPAAGLDNSHYSSYYNFEACDAPWWTQRGYIVASVDARGSFKSEGDKSFFSRDTGLDGYDIVEWLGAREWSNGKVGMYGASAFAMVQWLTAAEQPPSLAAIIPFDGMTDLYREMSRKGGIPETQFMAIYPHLFNWGKGSVEESSKAHFEHPFFDEYWQSKVPFLEDITCPAYVVCSWGDNGIHTRGTLNGWKKINSKHKYLEIHPYQKWEYLTTEESLTRQKAFYDTYLLDKETEVKFWPPVRWSMRERFYVSEWRYASTFPFPETEYKRLYLFPNSGLSEISPLAEQHVSYVAESGEITFDVPFFESYEFAGHGKLRLWVEARGANNMDIFVVLKKVDAAGNIVHFPWLTVIDDGPIAFGYLRVSRRELDEKVSNDIQPHHRHQRDILLEPGQIVPVDIEIQPTSCRFRAGDTLGISISGHDYGQYPATIPLARHAQLVNKGTHVIHYGGRYDSFLQLPVIPPVPGSVLRCHDGNPVKMTTFAARIKDWSDDKVIQEHNIFSSATANISTTIPFLTSYTQILGIPGPSIKTLCTNQSDFEIATMASWSSLAKLRGTFTDPGYKANADSQLLTGSRVVGSLSQRVHDVFVDPVLFKERKDAFETIIFLSKKPGQLLVPLDDLANRFEDVKSLARGTKLLRYVLNRDITPNDAAEYFRGAPTLENAEWGTIGAMEQYWFPDNQAAHDFFDNPDRHEALQKLPASLDEERIISVAGDENRVVFKDANF